MTPSRSSPGPILQTKAATNVGHATTDGLRLLKLATLWRNLNYNVKERLVFNLKRPFWTPNSGGNSHFTLLRKFPFRPIALLIVIKPGFSSNPSHSTPPMLSLDICVLCGDYTHTGWHLILYFGFCVYAIKQQCDGLPFNPQLQGARLSCCHRAAHYTQSMLDLENDYTGQHVFTSFFFFALILNLPIAGFQNDNHYHHPQKYNVPLLPQKWFDPVLCHMEYCSLSEWPDLTSIRCCQILSLYHSISTHFLKYYCTVFSSAFTDQ